VSCILYNQSSHLNHSRTKKFKTEKWSSRNWHQQTQTRALDLIAKSCVWIHTDEIGRSLERLRRMRDSQWGEMARWAKLKARIRSSELLPSPAIHHSGHSILCSSPLCLHIALRHDNQRHGSNWDENVSDKSDRQISRLPVRKSVFLITWVVWIKCMTKNKWAT
jgi:hypothetical protein